MEKEIYKSFVAIRQAQDNGKEEVDFSISVRDYLRYLVKH